MNRKTRKVNVLDTTVLIDNPNLPYEVPGGDVVIPIAVLKELDGLKNSDFVNTAKSAREVSRFLDKIGSYGDLEAGVRLSTGQMVRLYVDSDPVDLLDSWGDNSILGAAVHLKRVEKRDVVVVTTDYNMRVAARILGLKAKPPYFGTKDDFEEVSTQVMPVGGVESASEPTGGSDASVRQEGPERRFRDLADERTYREMQARGLDYDDKPGFWRMLWDIVKTAVVSWFEGREMNDPEIYRRREEFFRRNAKLYKHPMYSSLWVNIWHHGEEDRFEEHRR